MGRKCGLPGYTQPSARLIVVCLASQATVVVALAIAGSIVGIQ